MLSFSELLDSKYQKGHNNVVSWSPTSVVNMTDAADSVSSSAASLTHKEAERRRRQRINTHLSTLRTLLPSPARTDKASLLAEVVQHVKDLKRRMAELARQEEDTSHFPGEVDEARVSCYGEGLLKATLCCEDRPGLNRDLVKAMRSVRVRAVKAEMVTVGGRSKSVVVMKWTGGGGGEEELKNLKVALKAVVEDRVSGRVCISGKRARFYGSVYRDDGRA
ncbi:transcription factor bHLH30-like [Argentina anserina]|uniref:transcription factor bHLH30-like n=1 Tax=Argentina anserina TaxID=57926 RepID=UPI0021765AE3|nr:transcription factor bHLH30-like [Potentilla anserina]